MSENDEALLFESLRLELRRGSLILAVLASLRREQYGYSLRVALGEVCLLYTSPSPRDS